MKTPEEAKRSSLRDLFQSVLKDDMVLLLPVSITAKEVWSRSISEVSFSFNETISGKKKKVNLKEKEAKGVEKQKKEKKEGKQVTCLVCKLPVESGKKYCTIHEKVKQRSDGKKVQCRKYKKDGSRCNMQTTNKSGYCYYHD